MDNPEGRATFSDIYDKVFATIDVAKLPEDTTKMLEAIFHSCHATVNWKVLFEKWQQNDKGGAITEEMCNQMKEKGRFALQKKHMLESLSCFTTFIRLCQKLPDDTDRHCFGKKKKTQLILQGYVNRSMVFYRVQNYTRCLDDCDAALYLCHLKDDGDDDDDQTTSNNNVDYLLYERKGKCFVALGDKVKAKSNLKIALERATINTNIPEKLKEAFCRQTKDYFDSIADCNANDKNKVKEDEITKHSPMGNGPTPNICTQLTKTNVYHTSMSASAGIKYTPDKGRHIIARQNIDVGDVVLIEKANVAFSHFDVNSNCSKACHHCLSSICDYMAYFSPIVDGLAFCSWGCLQSALESYHIHERFTSQDYLNEVRHQDKSGGSEDSVIKHCESMFLAYKAIISKPASFYLADKTLKHILIHEPTFVLGVEKDGQIMLTPEEKQVKSLYNMETHEDKVCREERLTIALRAVILLHCLKQGNYFADLTSGLTEEQEVHFARLLFHFQFSIAHSVLAIYRVDGDISGNVPLTAVGSAIFDDLILFNHSCASNTTRFYQGEVILIELNIENVLNYVTLHSINKSYKKQTDSRWCCNFGGKTEHQTG